MLSVESIDSVLKSYYLDAICTSLNTGVSPLYQAIEKTAAEIRGKEAVVPTMFGLCGGLGTTEEAGELPDAGECMRAAFSVPLKNIYGVIDITDKAIRASRDNASGIVGILNNEIRAMVRSARFNLNRMLWMDGKGLLATVTAFKSGSMPEVTVDDARMMAGGMKIDIYRSGSILVSGIRVYDVDHVNNKFIAKYEELASVTLTSGDQIYVQKSKGSEVNGIPYLFSSDNVYFGIGKAANPGIKPTAKSLGDVLTVDAMQEFFDISSLRAGSDPDMIVCSPKTRRQYLKQLELNRRNIDYLNLDGGFKTLSFNGIPVVGERFAPDGEMYFLNTPTLKLVELNDWEWLEGENGSILSQLDRKAVYTATLVKYANFVAVSPRAQARLYGITDPVTETEESTEPGAGA